ncbi:MAG: mechanosensitive ion channel [Candidatus Lokiarchaeota archaeon]|nr:mechanosensitive ion channel [Candidatus Lokiarchaeota archaeon]
MSIFLNVFDLILDWLLLYLFPITVSILAILIGYIIYFILKRQFTSLVKHEKLELTTANNITKIIKYLISLIIITAILIQFAESLGVITALFTLAGGTIIGFAAMNTIGNMIAGIIIMVSRPFIVGDRIIYMDRIADITEIKLIYTTMVDLDNIKISVPNQKLITQEVFDFGKKEIIRRHVTITPGFEEDRKKVEEVLLEAAGKVQQVLKDPKPYVWINSFQSYAVEYRLYVFITDIKHLPLIESELHKAVLDSCKEYKIDIRTPLLHKQIDE